MKTKICFKCKKRKSSSEFHKSAVTTSKLTSYCKLCMNQCTLKAQEKNRKLGLCQCGRPPLENHKKCKICLQGSIRYSARIRKNRKKKGLCTDCGEVRDRGKLLQCSKCRSRARCKKSLIKRRIIDAYGGRCFCCKEKNLGFLTIDHPNNDGNEHRRLVGTGETFYRWLVRNDFPEDFRVLCYNCNCGRAKNGGICPHKGLR